MQGEPEAECQSLSVSPLAGSLGLG
jgi:hypothetical protein